MNTTTSTTSTTISTTSTTNLNLQKRSNNSVHVKLANFHNNGHFINELISCHGNLVMHVQYPTITDHSFASSNHYKFGSWYPRDTVSPRLKIIVYNILIQFHARIFILQHTLTRFKKLIILNFS